MSRLQFVSNTNNPFDFAASPPDREEAEALDADKLGHEVERLDPLEFEAVDGQRAARVDLLLHLHLEASDWSDRSTIEGAIERLASKLSIFVQRSGKALQIVE